MTARTLWRRLTRARRPRTVLVAVDCVDDLGFDSSNVICLPADTPASGLITAATAVMQGRRDRPCIVMAATIYHLPAAPADPTDPTLFI